MFKTSFFGSVTVSKAVKIIETVALTEAHKLNQKEIRIMAEAEFNPQKLAG